MDGVDKHDGTIMFGLKLWSAGLIIFIFFSSIKTHHVWHAVELRVNLIRGVDGTPIAGGWIVVIMATVLVTFCGDAWVHRSTTEAGVSG